MDDPNIVPLTNRRRDYILRMLATDKPENWIRIAHQELVDFGGRAFFSGCEVTYQNEKLFTTTLGRGWDRSGESVRLQYRVLIPGGGSWTPAGSQYYRTISNALSDTTEGKTRMEHHIDREKLIEVVTKNKETYELLQNHVKGLYRDEIEKKTEQHLSGEIPQNRIMALDKDGNKIDLPPDQSELYDRRIRALELDSRDVIVMDGSEYSRYVEDGDINLLAVAAIVKRLEEL